MTSGDSDWTLKDVKETHLSLEGKCQTEGCNNFFVFDVDKLMELRGPDYRLPKILPTVCAECGGQLKMELAMLHREEDETFDKD